MHTQVDRPLDARVDRLSGPSADWLPPPTFALYSALPPSPTTPPLRRLPAFSHRLSYMSASSIARVRQSIAKQTAAWPKDVLRPQVQFSACFQSLVDGRLDQLEKAGNQTLSAEDRAVVDSVQTGLRDLMANKWRDQVRLASPPTSRPSSAPDLSTTRPTAVPLDGEVPDTGVEADLLLPNAGCNRPRPAGRG